MVGKKKVLAIVGVACILVASLSVVYVAASPAWTIDDLVSYMEKTGKGKLYKTLYIIKNEIKPAIDVIYERTGLELDYETLEIEIQTLKSDTIIHQDGSDFYLYGTPIGGVDHQSDVYVLVSWRGQKVDATVTRTVKDGGKYAAWGGGVYYLETGLYDAYVTAPAGVAVGSYLVEVDATINILGKDFYGTATYVIDCTATIT